MALFDVSAEGLNNPVLGDSKTWHQEHAEQLSFGERLADTVAAGMGSWTFIIIQTVIIVIWIALNLVAFVFHFDPYPFILLNLVFSTQAAYAAPIIMQSQNRQSQRDRQQAEADYRTNIEAERRIEELQLVIARLENDKHEEILAAIRKIQEKLG